MDKKNHDWCIRYDQLYKQSWLECNENVGRCIEYYINAWKRAFNGELACIKFLVRECEQEKQKYLIQQRIKIIEYL
jgi:hypothetical protein